MTVDLKGYEDIYSIKSNGEIKTKDGKRTVNRSQEFSKGMMRTFYQAVMLIDDKGVKKVYRINDLLLVNFDRKDINFVNDWNLDHIGGRSSF